MFVMLGEAGTTWRFSCPVCASRLRQIDETHPLHIVASHSTCEIIRARLRSRFGFMLVEGSCFSN